MKISELIAELQQAQSHLGDADIYTVRSDMADYDPELTIAGLGSNRYLYIS
jgi:hypothetical protein